MRGHVYSALVGALAGVVLIFVMTRWVVPWLQDPTTGVPGWDPTHANASGLVGSEACLHCHAGPRPLHAGKRATSDLSPTEPGPDGLTVAALVGSGVHRQARLLRDDKGLLRELKERTPAGETGPGIHFPITGVPRGPGIPMTDHQAFACLSCHSTRGDVGDKAGLDDLVAGIGCEACHGPGQPHLLRLKETGSDVRPPRAGVKPVDRVRRCGRCHGNPADIPVSQALSLARGLADRPAFGVLMSRCFTAKEGPECTDCHDPHAPEKVELASATKVCLNCHEIGGAKTEKTCLEQPEGPCLDCHMPKQGGFGEAGNRDQYTDHWIRIRDRDPTPASLTTTPQVRWRTARFAGLLEETVASEEGTKRERGLRWLRLATVRGMAGQGEEAEEAGQKAVDLMPDEPFALYNLGNIYLSRGPNKQDQAIEVFRKALHLSPDHVMARIRLAEVFRRSGHFDEAENELREATQVRPDAAPAWKNLGEVLFSGGNTEGAAEAFEKAVEIAPIDKKSRNGLVSSYNKLGRYAEQIPHLKWLCEQDGSESQICGILDVITRKAKAEGQIP